MTKNTTCHWLWWDQPCAVASKFEVRWLKRNWWTTKCPSPQCPYQMGLTEWAVKVILVGPSHWIQHAVVVQS